jgi:hypothetical protein
VIAQLAVLNAVAELLRTSLHRPVGVVEIPPEVADDPYCIVYPLAPIFDGPPFTEPEADGRFAVQVTAVGSRWDQATWMADKVRVAVLSRITGGFLFPLPTIPGVTEMGRSIEYGPERVEGDKVDTVVQRFVFHLTGE